MSSTTTKEEEDSLSDQSDRSVSTDEDDSDFEESDDDDKSDDTSTQQSISTSSTSPSTTVASTYFVTEGDDGTYAVVKDLIERLEDKKEFVEVAKVATLTDDYTEEDDDDDDDEKEESGLFLGEFNDGGDFWCPSTTGLAQGIRCASDCSCSYSNGSEEYGPPGYRMPSPGSECSLDEIAFEVTASYENESEENGDMVDKEKMSEDESESVVDSFSVTKVKNPMSLEREIEDSLKSIEIDFASYCDTLEEAEQEAENVHHNEDIHDRAELDADKMFRSACILTQVMPEECVSISKPAGDSVIDSDNDNLSSKLVFAQNASPGWSTSIQIANQEESHYSLEDFDSGAEEKREEGPDLYDHKEAGHEFPVGVKPFKLKQSLAPLLPSPPTKLYPTGTFIFPPNLVKSSYYPGGNSPVKSLSPSSSVSQVSTGGGQNSVTPTPLVPFNSIRPVKMDSSIRSSQLYPSPGYSNVQYDGGRVNVCSQNGAFRYGVANFVNRNYGGIQYNLRPNNAAFQNRANFDGPRSYDRPVQQQQQLDYPRQFNSNQGQRTGAYNTTNSQTFSHEGFNPNRAAAYDTRPQGSSSQSMTTSEATYVASQKDFPTLQANLSRSEQPDLADSSGSKLVARSGQQQDWYDFEDLSTPSSQSLSNTNDRSTGYRSYGQRENVRTDAHFVRNGYGARGGGVGGGGGGVRYDNYSAFTAQRPTRYQDMQQASQVAPSIAPTSGGIPTWSSIVSNRH